WWPRRWSAKSQSVPGADETSSTWTGRVEYVRRRATSRAPSGVWRVVNGKFTTGPKVTPSAGPSAAIASSRSGTTKPAWYTRAPDPSVPASTPSRPSSSWCMAPPVDDSGNIYIIWLRSCRAHRDRPDRRGRGGRGGARRLRAPLVPRGARPVREVRGRRGRADADGLVRPGGRGPRVAPEPPAGDRLACAAPGSLPHPRRSADLHRRAVPDRHDRP